LPVQEESCRQLAINCQKPADSVRERLSFSKTRSIQNLFDTRFLRGTIIMARTSVSTRALLSTAALALFACGLQPHTAHAGFNWAPPPAATAPDAVKAAPVDKVEVIDNMVPPPSGPRDNAAAGMPRAPALSAAPGLPPEAASVPVDAQAVLAANPPPSYSGSADGGSYAIAQGFGKSIPLVIAVKQIVPPGYTPVFDRDAGLGQKVSWQGGQPWNEVLNNALAPKGLVADIKDHKVMIHTGRSRPPRRTTPPCSTATSRSAIRRRTTSRPIRATPRASPALPKPKARASMRKTRP
jgi:hypothetical protein